MDTIDLESGFQTFWSAIPNSAGVATVLTAIGVLIILFTVVPWIWQRRKGGFQGMQGFPWMGVVFAAVLAGPQVVIPLLLRVLSLLTNLLIQLANYILSVL